ncbi:MAG: B12-binding domain-containing radical SAM protein [Deltaproteobacteria bacterium]|nr:B12-binding domain-containing radical SAM protein [Deltaproteobacteria bacterium]
MPWFRKKILLIEPPFYRLYKESLSLVRFPLSLGYLSSAICQATDWEVKAFNADYSPKNEEPGVSVAFLAKQGFDNYLHNLRDASGPVWQEIRSVIREHRPAVVGISAKTQNFPAACAIAGIAKEIDRQILVIVGGPHPTMVRHKTLECLDIDIAVYGEGEETIAELLLALDSGRGPEGVPGIGYRMDGEVRETPPRKYIGDLDRLGFPHETAAEVLINYEHYPLQAFGNVFATRGCPFNCFFCGSRYIWSHRTRFRSPANVAAEIRKLMAKGLRSIHFDDDTFGVNSKYIKDLCDALVKHCPGLRWSCETHVNLVNDTTIGWMKSAGCRNIALGIESGNNEILKKIRKGFTIEEALQAVKLIKKAGIGVSTFFMVGFPFETISTLNDTINVIKKLKCDRILYSIFTPYPGTEAYYYCLQEGLITEDDDLSLYNHQSPLNCFTPYIPPDKFRELASNLEQIVDRKNYLSKLGRMVSLDSLRHSKDRGLKETIIQGLQVLLKRR